MVYSCWCAALQERVSAASGIKDPRELLPSHIDRFLLPYPTKPSISSLAQDFR